MELTAANVSVSQIPFLQCLEANGKPLSLGSDLFHTRHPLLVDPSYYQSLMKNKALLVEAYQWMQQTRIYDQKAIALQRTGQLGTYPSSLGQEAIGTAIGLAMRQDDVLAPYYRDHASQLIRGYLIRDLLLYWGGDERGSAGGPVHDLPICVPIATQASHAVGIAAAMKIKGEHKAVLTTIGDGGSSKGDFLEALNLAGAWQLPVVFIINNNQWAISVPRDIQCGAQTLAQKGVGAGLPSIQVDGNDFCAMYSTVNEALQRARAGKGASVIEAITYRLSDHTTADDATRYRDPEEVKNAWDQEPVKRLQHYLFDMGWWDQTQEVAWQKHCEQKVEEGIAAYKSIGQEPPEAMFDHLFDEFPEPMSGELDRLYAKHQTTMNSGGEL